MNTSSLLARRAATTAGVCLSCRRLLLRQFSSTPAAPFAASFQAYPLYPQQHPSASPPPQPQPRNTGVPDTSIARPLESASQLPRVHETRPPKDIGVGAGVDVDVSIPEREAQRSAPVASHSSSSAAAAAATPAKQSPATTPTKAATTSASTNASTTHAKPTPTNKPAARPSKLRAPRKAAMRLTPAAVDRVRALLEGPDPKLLRVGVRNRGCSGLAYHLEYVDKPSAFDEAVEQDGVRVLVDAKALFSIIGSEMDWVEDKLNQRFVFRNPNIKEQCGCGESFMV